MADRGDFFNKLFIIVSIANLAILLCVFSFTRNFSAVAPLAPAPELYSSAPAGEIVTETGDPFITRVGEAPEILTQPKIGDSDPIFGAKEAKVTIVEFSDFSCRFCGEQGRMIKELAEKYKDKIRLIWKDYPDEGKVSFDAALAGRCALAQGKFWDFHNNLFLAGGKIDKQTISAAAEKAGLTAAALADCLAGQKAAQAVRDNISEAESLRLPGVPYLFVNQQEVLGGIGKDELEKMILDEIEKN